MEPQNAAQQILSLLGVYAACGVMRRFRYATPERGMRKGEDGQRKAGGYGKGLRNWANRQAANATAQRLARRMRNA